MRSTLASVGGVRRTGARPSGASSAATTTSPRHGSFRRETLQALLDCLDRIEAGGSVGGLPTLWIHGADDQLVPVEPSRSAVRALVPDEHRTEDERADARHEVLNEVDGHDVIAQVTGSVDRVLDQPTPA